MGKGVSLLKIEVTINFKCLFGCIAISGMRKEQVILEIHLPILGLLKPLPWERQEEELLRDEWECVFGLYVN